MTGKTHKIGGVVAGLATSVAVGCDLKDTIIITGLSTLGSILPDIDHKGSTISKSAKISGFLVRLFTHHRGIFHTPVFWIAIYFGLAYLIPEYSEIFMWILIGCLSHLFLDMLNPVGIPLLFPFTTRKIHLCKIPTSSKGEHVIATLLTICICCETAILVGNYTGIYTISFTTIRNLIGV